MTKKGIALPIDMLVILAIAVIVLIAVIAAFMGVWSPTSSQRTAQQAFSAACMPYAATGCLNTDHWKTGDNCKAANDYLKLGVSGTDCTAKIDTIKAACGCGSPPTTQAAAP